MTVIEAIIAKQMQEEYSYFFTLHNYTPKCMMKSRLWTKQYMLNVINWCHYDRNDEQTINTKCFLLNDVKIRKQHLYFICFKNIDNKYLADAFVQSYLYSLPHNRKNVGFTI